jgi:hypothetical protein
VFADLPPDPLDRPQVRLELRGGHSLSFQVSLCDPGRARTQRPALPLVVSGRLCLSFDHLSPTGESSVQIPDGPSIALLCQLDQHGEGVRHHVPVGVGIAFRGALGEIQDLRGDLDSVWLVFRHGKCAS